MLTQSWSPVGRLTAQSLASAADRLLQHRDYAYRADGCLTEIRELTSGTRRFDLDGTGRVTGVRAHGWTETYAYDAAGNLVRADAPGHEASQEREFDGMLLRRAGRTTYEHDGQGRLVRRTHRLLDGRKRTWTYAWNAEDRLTEAVTPDGERWRYAYDPLGRRILKHRLAGDGSAADRTEFSWDDTRLAERTGPDGGVTTWDYAPGSHRPLTQTDHRPRPRVPGGSFLAELAESTTGDRDTRYRAVVTDGVGTPTELVTPEGQVVWQRRTTLWGTPFPSAADASAEDCPLRFPGQYADAETGLHYNFHRYYDPETAQYISPDPLGMAAAPNPVAYVSHPLCGMDPLGLYDCTKVNKVIDKVLQRATGGRRSTATGYHGHLSTERELEILSNPDGVYISQGGAERLIFHQGEDIVVTESKGGGGGNVITSYGPSGPKNDSRGRRLGAASPEDPGPAVTKEMIVEGKIPTPKGGTLPPATPLR
ncbi:RHS repeat-associated core domain-containing protein [Streptomyces sp. L7]